MFEYFCKKVFKILYSNTKPVFEYFHTNTSVQIPYKTVYGHACWPNPIDFQKKNITSKTAIPTGTHIRDRALCVSAKYCNTCCEHILWTYVPTRGSCIFTLIKISVGRCAEETRLELCIPCSRCIIKQRFRDIL